MGPVLSRFQKQILNLWPETELSRMFYLAGGTALAQYYFQHRKSEDLDFFTEEELSLPELERFISFVGGKTSLSKVEYKRRFGLYTYFLYPKGEKKSHKIDFGQYPFPLIERPRNFNGILVESLYDIAVDKAHTISVRPRLRDFIDLYFILRERTDWKIRDLLRRGFEKFGIQIEALQLGENLFQVKKLEDMPVMLKRFDRKAMNDFFLSEAKRLGEGIWE